MAFRIFRNDALQKYRAQFDLAARYVYMTAKAYDYETNLLSSAGMAGEQFLTDVVRCRALGVFDSSGEPMTGGETGYRFRIGRHHGPDEAEFQHGARGQLVFNNPQTETNPFSLRYGLFRTAKDDSITTDDAKWRAKLRSQVVDNILALPEYRQFCTDFGSSQSSEPGIVIKFSTEIAFAKNFFGWPLSGGDSSRTVPVTLLPRSVSVGVWFSNYNSVTGTNGLTLTPRVYLFRAGRPYALAKRRQACPQLARAGPEDARTVPDQFSEPYKSGLDSQVDSFGEVLADIRRYPDFRAYHDGGTFDPGETMMDNCGSSGVQSGTRSGC